MYSCNNHLTEAEYAWHGACSLVPLKVQPHYNPDGWLVPIVDGRMTYDLSSDENLDTLLPSLIREIGNRGRARVIEHFDGEFVCNFVKPISNNNNQLKLYFYCKLLV